MQTEVLELLKKISQDINELKQGQLQLEQKISELKQEVNGLTPVVERLSDEVNELRVDAGEVKLGQLDTIESIRQLYQDV